jgi:hypothetical protein
MIKNKTLVKKFPKYFWILALEILTKRDEWHLFYSQVMGADNLGAAFSLQFFVNAPRKKKKSCLFGQRAHIPKGHADRSLRRSVTKVEREWASRYRATSKHVKFCIQEKLYSFWKSIGLACRVESMNFRKAVWLQTQQQKHWEQSLPRRSFQKAAVFYPIFQITFSALGSSGLS